MQADFDAVWRQSGESVCHGVGDQCPVGEECNKKPLRDGMVVEVEEIRSCQRFASGEAEFQTAGVSQLVHDVQDLIGRQLFTNLVRAVEAVRVAHHATQVAATGDLPLAGEGKAVGQVPEAISSDHR